jgi:hypothetical protein
MHETSSAVSTLADQRISRRDLTIIGAALVLTLGSGTLHVVIGKTRLAAGLTATQEQLDGLPAKIGNYELVGTEPLDGAALALLKPDAYTARNYLDAASGQRFSLMVLAGPALPLAVHTPDVCYASQTYVLDSEDELLEVPYREQVHVFRMVKLVPRAPTQPGLQVIYGWNAGRGYVAPSLARVRLAGYERLVKVQVAIPTERERQWTAAQCRALMESLLPILPH